METDERLQVLAAQTDQQIAWALAHPGTSEWLKQSLEAALDCNPVVLLNELEILKRLLESRAELQIRKDTLQLMKR